MKIAICGADGTQLEYYVLRFRLCHYSTPLWHMYNEWYGRQNYIVGFLCEASSRLLHCVMIPYVIHGMVNGRWEWGSQTLVNFSCLVLRVTLPPGPIIRLLFGSVTLCIFPFFPLANPTSGIQILFRCLRGKTLFHALANS